MVDPGTKSLYVAAWRTKIMEELNKVYKIFSFLVTLVIHWYLINRWLSIKDASDDKIGCQVGL